MLQCSKHIFEAVVCVMICLSWFFPNQYMSKVEPWCKACGEGELPSELQDLEDMIHHHQGLYEHITTAYSEVSAPKQACTKTKTKNTYAKH